MALIKTAKEIKILKEGGIILSRILREIRGQCVEGVGTDVLDALARKRFAETGARSSFLGYRVDGKGPAFPGSLCISINEEVVHGLPIPKRIIRKGNVIGLDIGMWYKDLATDMATTVLVGECDSHVRLLTHHTREALERALSILRDGAWVSDIGGVIEDYIKPHGYGIVRDLVGHGVGHDVHEEPQIPNYRDHHAPPFQLKTGMVIAIEPMITLGSWRVKIKDDGWTIVTADGSPSAHFEVTVAITDTGYELITPWPDK